MQYVVCDYRLGGATKEAFAVGKCQQQLIRLVDELTEAFEAIEAASILATHDRQLLRDTEHWHVLAWGMPRFALVHSLINLET